MLLLTATTDKFQLVSSTAASLDVHAGYMDSGNPITSSYSMAPGRQNTAIVSATTTDIVAAPGASTARNVKVINVRNKDASLSCDVTIVFNQNGTSYQLHKQTLRAGETLQYVEGVGWFLAGGNGTPPTVYSTADQSITTADTYITGSQILLPSGRTLVAGCSLKWEFTITKSAGTGTTAWNIRFGSGVIGDTARVTLTQSSAQTGVADTAVVRIRCLVRSVGGSGVVTGSLELSHNLAATGFVSTSQSVLTGTSAGFDTTTVTGVGVSVTPGTASAWTVIQATGAIENLN